MDKQNENQLGNRIAELRREAGLTQEQLAGMLGVTYQAVSKWETGNSYPDISLLPRLSEIFHVSLDSLFGKEDSAILTEHVLEKAVKAASMEEPVMEAHVREESADRGTSAEESGRESDSSEKEENGKKGEKSTKRESDPAQSFGEYIGNIVNMSLKSGINGIGKAVDTLKKIDFKNLDFKDLDQSISDKVKRAVERGKKGHFFSGREEGNPAGEEEIGNENETGRERRRESETDGESVSRGSSAEEVYSKQDHLYAEMEHWGGKKTTDIPWEDDGKIRVVAYLGRNMLSAKEYRGWKGRFSLDMEGSCRDVVTYMNVSCEEVTGSVKAGGDVSCDQVGGNVGAEGQVSCDNVNGSVFAGGSVSCDTVNGNVVAGGNVTCDEVFQDVTAGGNVECDHIGGNVMAPHVGN